MASGKPQNIGVGMLVYCLFFMGIIILWAFRYGMHYGKSLGMIMSDAIYYMQAYKISLRVFSFFAAWILYLLSGIGLIMNKDWGRLLGVFITGAMVLWSFGFWLFAILNDIFRPVIFSGTPGHGFGTFVGFFALIIPIGLPSLGFLIGLINLEKE